MSASVEYASISISAEGTPESTNFSDVYFSREDGIAESTYVFIEQNNLLSRWHRLNPTDRFVIAETGFGSGLNFLLSWQLFEQTAPPGAKLHFISFEKFPIHPADLKRIHQQWPGLQPYCEILQHDYPPNLKGIHRLQLSETITLDLCFGDVNDSVPDWAAANPKAVHAWFLDGFAPGKNPDMWSDPLYKSISQSMAPTATLATFTATGHVRRGLQRTGIQMQKVKGFGSKRDMLVGKKYTLGDPAIYCATSGSHIAIVGGGIAGAGLLTKLRNHTGPVTLFLKGKQPADGASGNPQGAVYPLLQAQWNNVSEFYSHGFLHAQRFYQATVPQVCVWSGVQLLGHSPATVQRFRELAKASYPGSMLRLLTRVQAEKAANYQHGYCAALLPEAGWVEPVKLVQQLISDAVAFRNAKGLPISIQSEAKVTALKSTNSGWEISSLSRGSMSATHAEHVILASGSSLTSLLPEPLIPIRPAQGQIVQVKSEHLSAISQVLCHKGYAAPVQSGVATRVTTLGATFNKGSHSEVITESDSVEILKLTNKYLGTSLDLHDVVSARASVRATTPDHLPVIGTAPASWKGPADKESVGHQRGLWVLCGLGARGFTSAPWCAELLISQIYKKPLPCGERLLNALSPSRFAVRALRRNQSPIDLK